MVTTREIVYPIEVGYTFLKKTRTKIMMTNIVIAASNETIRGGKYAVWIVC